MASPMDGTESTKLGTGDRYTPGPLLLSPMDGLAPPKRDGWDRYPVRAPQGPRDGTSRRAHNPLPLAKLVRLQPLQRRRRSERERFHTAQLERSTRSVGTDPRWCSGSMPALEAVRAWFESTTGNHLRVGQRSSTCFGSRIRLVRLQPRRPRRARLLVRASALQAGAAGFDPLARYCALALSRGAARPINGPVWFES
jgi:hypothetical protein